MWLLPLSPKRWTYHRCCIYYINISLLQWRLRGNLHRQKRSGAENPTRGGRRPLLASKTLTLEQREAQPLSQQWGSCASEAALTSSMGAASRDNTYPPWEISHSHGVWATRSRQFTHAEYRITYPLQSSIGVIAICGGALVRHPLSGEPSHLCSPKRMCCPRESSQKHVWPS